MFEGKPKLVPFKYALASIWALWRQKKAKSYQKEHKTDVMLSMNVKKNVGIARISKSEKVGK